MAMFTAHFSPATQIPTIRSADASVCCHFVRSVIGNYRRLRFMEFAYLGFIYLSIVGHAQRNES